MKKGGKEVGYASVYAPPHTMTGAAMNVKSAQDAAMLKGKDPNKLTADQMGPRSAVPRVSMGDPAADDVKTTGMKMRGTGAATKGVMSRGPMA
jgi:hypothetical protein